METTNTPANTDNTLQPSVDETGNEDNSILECLARTSIDGVKAHRAASVSTCSVTTWNLSEYEDSYEDDDPDEQVLLQYKDDEQTDNYTPSLFEELAKFQRQHSITGTEVDLQPSLVKLERRQSVDTLDPRKQGVYRQPVSRSILNDPVCRRKSAPTTSTNIDDDEALARRLQYDQLETDEMELALFLSRQEHYLSQFEKE